MLVSPAGSANWLRTRESTIPVTVAPSDRRKRNGPQTKDSVEKIVTTYFSAVCTEPFTYRGLTYNPKPLQVSPAIFHGYTCPTGCGGCCKRYSNDYLPFEYRPDDARLALRQFEFDGRQVPIYSDLQGDHERYFCRYLSTDDGRCGLHPDQPFSCDFELLRFTHFSDDASPTLLATRLFGRGWIMKRIDGERGAKCEILPVTPEHYSDAVRKLKRLAEWCDHFGVTHRVGQIIDWAHSGIEQPLILR